jgi:hypothetical protein
MSTLVESSEVLAVEASCTDHALTVILDDGRTVSVPLVWFPRLLTASPKQRKDWELIGGGIGLHWDAIDEDISVASLLQPEKFIRMANVGMQTSRFSERALRVPSANKKRSTRRS